MCSGLAISNFVMSHIFILFLFFQGKAVGHLYADDYRTFQYKNGEYIHRGLIFANSRLESK